MRCWRRFRTSRIRRRSGGGCSRSCLGTFFLVLVACGGGVMGEAFPNTISRTAAVTAPGLMVLAIILFMGRVSGAHLNPAVSVAFSLRGDFPWRRVPGYIVVQLVGASLAAWFVQSVVNASAVFGSNYPASGYIVHGRAPDGGRADPRAGQRDPRNRIGRPEPGSVRRAGGRRYIILAGLWGSPISGASMNPARTFGPDLVGRRLHQLLGVRRRPADRGGLAVVAAYVLRGPGGGEAGSGAAQGGALHRGRNTPTRSSLRVGHQPGATAGPRPRRSLLGFRRAALRRLGCAEVGLMPAGAISRVQWIAGGLVFAAAAGGIRRGQPADTKTPSEDRAPSSPSCLTGSPTSAYRRGGATKGESWHG